jgi:hypothetical protein
LIASVLAAGSTKREPWGRGCQSTPGFTSSLHGLQPTPRVLSGYGSRVLAVRIPRKSPLVVTGHYTGEDDFIVHLVGQGADERLFNVIGRYTGQAAVEDLRPGRYRVAVQAEGGSWSLRFAQPTPCSCAIRIPTTLRGYGSRVIQIRTTRAMQPVFTARYSGDDNFIVHVLGFGDTTGFMSVFNEIGPYRGQALAESRLPRGHYLLEAAGYFTRAGRRAQRGWAW